MKAPAFWYPPANADKSSLCATALTPLACAYTKIGRWHRARSTPRNVKAPVICLGNLVAGGSGKTPTAISLIKLLRDKNIFLSPAFVTRGYKGKVEGPELVDDTNSPTFWGDEALLLHRAAPTYVAHNRYAGAELAVFNGADAIILDDGLQHYGIAKNITFCVIDGLMGFGNGHVIPAGPLRQPMTDGFARIDAFILIGDDTHNIRQQLPSGKPVFTARVKIREPLELAATPYIAFCGIGYPEKFRHTIAEAGVQLAGWHPFPDHHAYTIADMSRLVNDALTNKARLLTTEKDYVRLPDFTQKSMIDVLPIDIVFDETDKLIDFIRTCIPAASK